MEEKIHAVLLVLKDRTECAPKLNQVLNKYGDMVLGRLGLPQQECSHHVYIITLVVRASEEQLKGLKSDIEGIEGIEVRCTGAACCQ